MASYGYTFQSGDGVTPTRLNDARTVSDIVNADIKSDAAIAATKLASDSITNTQIKSDAAIAATKLASDSITNTQIKSDAAIAGTKIAPNFGSQNVVTTGTATAADFRITGTTTAALINYNGTQTIVTPNVADWATSIRLAGGSDAGPNVLQFWANNNERMRIDASGNVGIGATPSHKLDVVGNDVIVRALDTRSTGLPTAYFQAQNGKGVTANFQVYDDFGVVNVTSNHRLELRTNNAIRLNIKSTGQVRFVPLSADPAGAEAGDVYYNSSSNKLKVYNGSSWVDLH